jgi:hypothetical protein
MSHHLLCQLFAHILALGENNDVVQIALHLLIVYCPLNTVHASLKDRRCVAQAKLHDCILEGPHEALQGSATLVALLDADLVVGVPKINLGELAHLRQILANLVSKRQGVKLLYCRLVNPSIIKADTCSTILLFNEKQQRNCLGLRFAVLPRLQH